MKTQISLAQSLLSIRWYGYQFADFIVLVREKIDLERYMAVLSNKTESFIKKVVTIYNRSPPSNVYNLIFQSEILQEGPAQVYVNRNLDITVCKC